MKGNVIVQLEFELTYYDVEIQLDKQTFTSEFESQEKQGGYGGVILK